MIEFLIFLTVFIIALIIIIFIFRRRENKLMRNLDKMLDSAIDGNFTEKNIDESMLSAIEAKFARYLSASEFSAKNTAAEKEKIKELISDISHQTKTPLSNILLYSDLLKEQELDAEARSCADFIGSQAEKLSFLIAALVKLSRLETGVFQLAPEYGKIAPALEKNFSEYLPKAREKGLEFTLDPTSAEAYFDEKWCGEAIGAIVDNAVKYTDKGKISISVKEYEMFCAVIISDSGIGIPEDEQGKIFGRFYRSPAVSQKDGLGIGLYLAREIISGCEGYIKISSEINKGTDFYVFLKR